MLGSGTLLGMLLLTGVQPSVLRAVLMGLGALTALVMRRKTKPLGALILTAVLLLLFNPLWIWDLGFQLSFLATLGLLVTVPPLMGRLDWLPTLFAGAIAIPLAATLWTLPLQLYHFGVAAPYGILVNLLVTPLVDVHHPRRLSQCHGGG
ncbi:MAG: ComEC/Rec2 family competence protein [Synechococcales cyanobacterium RM1_1_8]|nr:ComEC/Rec2 family competence protein [Synechococcales cyanobacterium RM1_1_8]